MGQNLIILGISFIPVVPAFWVEDKPKTPPSHSADIAPITFKEGLKRLFSTRQFVYLFVILTAMLGMFNAYITLISNYVTPFGYSESDAGNLGVVTIVVGIVSAAVIGPYLDFSKNHAMVLKICCFVTTAGSILCFIGCQPDSLYLWYIGSVLFGLGGFPIVPMVLELGVEVTFPIDEGTSAGFLLLGGNAGGIFFLFVSNALSFDGNLKYGVLLLVIGAGIAAVTSLFFKNENRRNKEDVVKEEANEVGNAVQT
ncbi:Major facilitator super domain-containing protein 7 [Terramyces sp. JEL0728]|nr:Major facilitator super domain-containing protein 7 [Terramyces sp. JEL0728]